MTLLTLTPKYQRKPCADCTVTGEGETREVTWTPVCRNIAVCRMSPRSSTGCDGLEQRGRDRRANGVRFSFDLWGR